MCVAAMQRVLVSVLALHVVALHVIVAGSQAVVCCGMVWYGMVRGGGENAVAGIGKKCGKMRKKCGKCEKKCGIKCGFATML